MDKIPTIDELFDRYSILCSFEEGDSEYLMDKEDFKEALVVFTKSHTREALVQASKKAKIYKSGNGGSYLDASIDENSILNAYDLNNIK